jgi:hypothetical protein
MRSIPLRQEAADVTICWFAADYGRAGVKLQRWLFEPLTCWWRTWSPRCPEGRARRRNGATATWDCGVTSDVAALRKLTGTALSRICLIFINQIREKLV